MQICLYGIIFEKVRYQKCEVVQIVYFPNLPEAHRSLGRYYMFIGAFDSAEKSFLRSVEIDPKFAIGYRTNAWLKCLTGQHENAIHWAKLSCLNKSTFTH